MDAAKPRRAGLVLAITFFVLQLAYWIMPVDVIPDVVPLMGLVDDFVVSISGLTASAVAGGAYLNQRRKAAKAGEEAAQIPDQSAG